MPPVEHKAAADNLYNLGLCSLRYGLGRLSGRERAGIRQHPALDKLPLLQGRVRPLKKLGGPAGFSYL